MNDIRSLTGSSKYQISQGIQSYCSTQQPDSRAFSAASISATPDASAGDSSLATAFSSIATNHFRAMIVISGRNTGI